MMAKRTDFNGSNTQKRSKSPCSFQKTACSFHSFEPILSKRAKKKSPANPLVYRTSWRRVRDSNPRFLLGTQHFECCTFDHSDNSPCLFSSGFLSRNLLKNSLERKQERRQKIFDFEIFCVEEYQGESGGRNSQLLPKFRVSPVMTASIRFHIRLKHGKTRFAHTILSVLKEKVKRFLAKRLTYTGQSGYNNCVL